MVTPIGLWLQPHGVQRDSGADHITVGVAAQAAGGGVNFVRYTVNGGAPVDVSVAALTRFDEQVAATDPLTGCAAGQQAPCVVYPLTLSMAALPAGAITLNATVFPMNGDLLVLPTQTHWNNKNAALTRIVMHLNYATGNDANAGTASGTSVKTMQAALTKGMALAAGNDLGLVDVLVHGACLWNQAVGAGTLTVTRTASRWTRIIAVDGTSSIAKEGDWLNRVTVSGSVGFWFQNLIIIGKLRTQVTAGQPEVCFDHCTVKPHAPWDTTSNPWVGAYDEGRHGLFYLSNGEPATTWALGCDIAGMDLPFSDKNTIVRGCKAHRAYGVFLQLAGGDALDTVKSNVGVVSCDVEQWRHSSDNVRGYFNDVVSTGIEFVDNGGGKLRVREQSAGTVADFSTESANLVSSTTWGVHIDDLTSGGAGGAANGVCQTVLAAGLDGSGRQFVDLNIASAGLTHVMGNTVTVRPGRVQPGDGLSWSNAVHGDLVKLNSPVFARNFIWNVRGAVNSTPRGLGLDSHMDAVWIFSTFHSLSHASVRNDDLGAPGHVALGVVVENYSDGSLNLLAGTTFFVELRDSVLGGVNGSNLATNWIGVNNHFVQAGQAFGANPTTGAAFKFGDPGVTANATLLSGSIAVGSASGQQGRPSPWFTGNRGVLLPGLVGDFSIPALPGGNIVVDVDPMRFHFGFNGLAERDTLKPLAPVLVRPVWPPGSLGGGVVIPLETGTATSANATTLTDSTKAWPANSQAGMFVTVPATNARKNIESNTGTILTLCAGETFDAATQTALNAHAAYEIGPLGPAISLQTVDSPRCRINPHNGSVEPYPANFPYPAATVGALEPSLDEQDQVATFDATTQLRSKVAHRAAFITRERIVMQHDGRSYDYEYLKRQAAYGLGSSFGGAKFVDEFRSSPKWSRHNPTHGGSAIRPFLNGVTNTSKGCPLIREMPGVPITGGTFSLSGPPGIARFRGAVIPLEFGADGGPGAGGPWQNMGGDNNTFAIYPFDKQVAARDPFFGGRKFITRHVNANYEPDVYDHTQYGAVGEFNYDGPTNSITLDPSFDEAYAIDPVTGAVTQIDPVLWATGIGNNWQIYHPATAGLRLIPAVGPVVNLPNPFSAGYGAVVLRRTSDDLAFGLVMKLRDLNTTTVTRNGAAVNLFLTQGQRVSVTSGIVPDYDDPDLVGIGCDNTTYFDPVQGWQGITAFHFHGPWTEAVPAIREVYTAGLLDAPLALSIFDDIPSVLVGTDLERLQPTHMVVDVDPMAFTLRFAAIDLAGIAPFVVEDGSGRADANSLCSVEVADAYFTSGDQPAIWSAATLDAKQRALRIATIKAMETRYLWKGRRLTQAQALEWPRAGVVDLNGYVIAINVVPLQVQQATAEYALRVLEGVELVPDVTSATTTGGSQSAKFGPFSISASAGSTGTTQRRIVRGDQLVAGLIVPPGGPRWLMRA